MTTIVARLMVDIGAKYEDAVKGLSTVDKSLNKVGQKPINAADGINHRAVHSIYGRVESRTAEH